MKKETTYFKDTPTTITLDFPALTAKEIYDTYGPKFSDGVPMIYPLWFEEEEFWATQKSRPGRKTITKDCVEKEKNWNDCKAYAEKQGGQMLNYAELLWLVYQYDKHTGKRILESEYTWLDTPVGGRVGASGGWLGDGPDLRAHRPRGGWSDYGLLFSCTENDAPMNIEPMNLEQAVQACKEAGYKVFKEL